MIRPATEQDLPFILKMCEQFWRASQTLKYDHEHTKSHLKNLFDNMPIFVSEIDGEIGGFIIMAIGQHLCNPAPNVAEIAWYMTPSKRRGRDGIELMKAAENYARLIGAASMSMIFMESSMPKTVQKIYDKMGYKLAETTYVRYF